MYFIPLSTKTGYQFRCVGFFPTLPFSQTRMLNIYIFLQINENNEYKSYYRRAGLHTVESDKNSEAHRAPGPAIKRGRRAPSRTTAVGCAGCRLGRPLRPPHRPQEGCTKLRGFEEDKKSCEGVQKQ